MKHNFLASRHLDMATETKGGSTLEAIKEYDQNRTKQIAEIEAKHKKELDDAKAAHQKALDDLKKANEDDISKAKAQVKEALDKVEALEKKMSTDFATGHSNEKAFSVAFEEKLLSDDHKKALQAKTPNHPVELSAKVFGAKAVADMTSAGNLTGSYLATPDVRGGIVMRPYEQLHLRDLLPIGRTTSGIIRHVRDNGGEGGPGMVAELGTKPKMDRDLSIEDAPVRKIATHMRVPDEMMEDIPYLASFLSNIGVEEVMAVEDSQIIYGDGTGQNLTGLFTIGVAFAAGGSAATIPDANHFDVLKAARKQMRKAKRTPSFALVSPEAYFQMTSKKDTTNNYILQGGGNGIVPTLDGVPIVELNQMADDDFLLGDRRAAEIDFRQNVIVRFYDQDRDNAIVNAVTIVIEERIALPVYYSNGFIKGTFAAAKTALLAA